MPFGLKTAPTRFQRFVNEALKPVMVRGDVVAYNDDFLIATKTIEYHLQIFSKVLRLLVGNKLELRQIDKCKFILSEVEYLRYSVSEQGITPTKRGIEAASERNLETLREKASKEIKNSQQYNKRYYYKKRKPPLKYNVGDLVVLKNLIQLPESRTN